jgi:hypothetical protein
MHDRPSIKLSIGRTGGGIVSLLLAGAASLALSASAEAGTLTITPIFGSSITGNANAAQIEGAINTAIGTIDGLYTTGTTPNNESLNVNFSYNPAAAGNLLSTSQFFYGYSYSAYQSALAADSTANPSNTNLAAGVAHLFNPGAGMVLAYGQALQLANYGLTTPTFAGNAMININSNANFDFTRPVNSSQFDAIGGLEHELDEVLGGGGAGSGLNNFFGSYGPTDLYRYSALGTPSYTTSSSATSYFSINGGLTSIAGFNQGAAPPAGCPGGDFGDWAPNGTGAGQRIQNACNSTGQDAAYTTSSPEYVMETAIGWDPQAVPAPLIGFGLPVFLAIGGLFFGAKLLQRSRRDSGLFDVA